MNWYKKTTLDPRRESNQEIWIRDNEEFVVETLLGKKTNLLALKKDIVGSLAEKVDYYQTSRKDIYLPENLELVKECPVCQSSSEKTKSEVNIYGAEYVSCDNCTHIYVKYRPTKTAIDGFYLNNVTYAATYTDKSSAESRLETIAVPWRDWAIKVFEQVNGRKPKSILDVGSGAGHFVEACRRAGLKADGIELSESSRQFARDIWGIELDGSDFTQVYDQYLGYDMVTFWGLLEHTPNPGSILGKASEIVGHNNDGLVISKVPRWNSMSSAIQTLSPETVIRHLDPMGHIMCFTDSSIAELYYKCGLKPTNAWYYGMDVYETMMQIGHNIKDYKLLTETGELQMNLQQYVDEMNFSDGITLVGKPRS